MKNNKEWYLINSDWLKDWKMFVNNKRSAVAYGTRKSNKKGVGILDPGPISNYQLFDHDKKPKEGLEKGRHYRGVNREVWQQLYITYGGGPIIHRNELNIYANEYEDNDNSDFDSDLIQNHFGNDDDADEAEVGNELGKLNFKLILNI